MQHKSHEPGDGGGDTIEWVETAGGYEPQQFTLQLNIRINLTFSIFLLAFIILRLLNCFFNNPAMLCWRNLKLFKKDKTNFCSDSISPLFKKTYSVDNLPVAINKH